MRTQRRLLLAILGAVCSLGLFAVYHRLLGGLDGLPTLPDRYLVAARSTTRLATPRRQDRTSQWLQQAFGEHCPELRYNHHLRLQAQGLILAFHDYQIVDGKFVLAPFSLAMIGRIDPRTRFPEISTIHCDLARLTFDRPVETFSDIARSKLRAAEFIAATHPPTLDSRAGKIHVSYNHATPETSDDLMGTTPGPVYFEEHSPDSSSRPQLWTDRGIEITDWQTEPPAVLRAERFSLFLEANALRPAATPPNDGRHPSGVRQVTLSNVFVQLPVDRSTAILGGADAPSRESNRSAPPIVIRTRGTLVFDVRQMFAEFAPTTAGEADPHPISVSRRLLDGTEELLCQTLGIRFTRSQGTSSQPASSPAPPSQARSSQQVSPPLPRTAGFSIEEIRAVGQPVTIRSSAERFQAHGRSLVVKPALRQATLTGEPAKAWRDGHRLECPELTLCQPIASPVSDRKQLGSALGPGRLTLLDPDDHQREIDISWKREFSIEREGPRDRLRLWGEVRVVDRVGRQQLFGEQMTLLVHTTNKFVGRGSAGSDPRMLASSNVETIEVTGQVRAINDQLVIDDAHHVRVLFHDAPPQSEEPVEVAAMAAAAPSPIEKAGKKASGVTKIRRDGTPPPDRPPLRLRADTIHTHLYRRNSRLDLDRVECRGDVLLSQKGSPDSEQNLSVRANNMVLTHTADGDLLQLFGKTGQPALVSINELSLSGPRIDFDPRDNRVEIEGAGAAEIRVGTNFRGEKITQPTIVTVTWQRMLEFRGNRISFDGEVRAKQETRQRGDLHLEHEINQVTCRRLDVYLDRVVSLSSWQPQVSSGALPPTDKPRIRKVVCHPGADAGKDVPVEVFGQLFQGGQLQRRQQIRAAEVVFDNDSGELIAQGEDGRGGEFRLFHRQEPSRRTSMMQTTPIKSLDSPSFGGRVIHVWFRRALRANHKAQTITFTDSVTTSHIATDDPDAEIHPHAREPGMLTLRCRTLEVALVAAGSKRQLTMLAQGKAEIDAREFLGQADTIKYDESKKQLVIFDSEEGNPVTLQYTEGRGREPMTVRGRTIYYWRETNEFRGIGLIAAEGSK